MNAGEAIQDLYPESRSHCYGCGRLNEHGLQIKSYWDGAEGVARFLPAAWHLAYPDGRSVGSGLDDAFVTASLNVEFQAPTPAGEELELRARAVEIGRRKVIVAVEMFAAGSLCASGLAVAVRMPASMRAAMA
jgi:hypothetical protein